MPLLPKNPVFLALLLTGVISGSCMALIGMPGQPVKVADTFQPQHYEVSVEADQPLLQDLMERVEHLEGELGKVKSYSEEPQLMAMLEGFRNEIESFRKSQGNRENSNFESTDLEPTGISNEFAEVLPESDEVFPNFSTTNELHEQVFSFYGPVIPESLLIIQGPDAGHPVLIELLDRHGNWVEVYSDSKPAGIPAVESWLDCPGAPLTEQAKVTVEGGMGVEMVPAQRGASLLWSEFSN